MYKVITGVLHYGNDVPLYKLSYKAILTYKSPVLTHHHNICCYAKVVTANIYIKSIFEYGLQLVCRECGASLIHGSYKSSTDLRRTIRGWRLE